MKNVIETIEEVKKQNGNLFYILVNNYLSIAELEDTIDFNYSIAYYDELDQELSETGEYEEALEDLVEDTKAMINLIEELDKK